MAYRRVTGKRYVRTLPSADTLAAHDLVQFDEAGEVISAKTGKEVLGIALTAATASTNVDVDILRPKDIVECDTITTGEVMAAAEVGNEFDLDTTAPETTITTTESNGDGIFTGWDTTTTSKAYITFKNLAYGSSGVGVEST